jgi:hypothetical protein
MTGPSRGKAVAYAAALFLAGGICGAMIMARISTAAQSLKVGRTDEIAVKIQEKLKTGLGLTPEQLAKFEPLIVKAAGELESSHSNCLDRISMALDTLHNQITPELTPEQKQKLESLEKERAAQMLLKYNYQLSGTNRTNK